MKFERSDQPGLKVRINPDGSRVGYWVASSCTRHAKHYHPKTVRLSGPEEQWPERCRALRDELAQWLREYSSSGRRRVRYDWEAKVSLANGGEFVYLIKRKNLIKIGHTRKCRQRFADLENSAGEPLQVIGITQGTREDEQRLHKLFSEHRTKGEWFRCTGEVAAFVKDARASMAKAVKKRLPPDRRHEFGVSTTRQNSATK